MKYWMWISVFILSSVLSVMGQDQETEDDVFTEETIVTDVTDTANVPSGSDSLLSDEKTRIGGTFSLQSKTNVEIKDSPLPLTELALATDLFLDARPDTDFRVFVKGALSYNLADGVNPDPSENLRLKELFADITLYDRVFARAGKQVLAWGVGYFFSPADIVNLSRIVPDDPLADREGPVALKLHLPVGTNNFYLNTIVDDLVRNGTAAVAPKVEFVLGTTEIGVGGYYKVSGPAAGMVTLTSSSGDFDVFGEGMLLYGSEKVFVGKTSDFITYPLGLKTWTRPNEIFLSATLGFLYTYDDALDLFDFSFAAQYYYNGLGYADMSVFRDAASGIGALTVAGILGMDDLAERGQHYGAASAGWNGMFDSDFSLRAFWIGALADFSGRADGSLVFAMDDYVTVALGVNYNYGTAASEFAPGGSKTVLYLKTQIGTGAF